MTPEEKSREICHTSAHALIEIIVNQTSWHYLCAFDDPVPFQQRSKKSLHNETPKDVMLQVYKCVTCDDEDIFAVKIVQMEPQGKQIRPSIFTF